VAASIVNNDVAVTAAAATVRTSRDITELSSPKQLGVFPVQQERSRRPAHQPALTVANGAFGVRDLFR
jgi:hypothetical protein